MRAIGSCSSHPSREARLRCRSCRKWICDRCVQVIAGHIYCGRTCRLQDLKRRILGRLSSLAVISIHPAWAVAVVAVAASLLLIGIGSRIATLMDLAVAPPNILQPRPTRTPEPVVAAVAGHLVQTGRTWRLKVSGEPDNSLLMALDDGSLRLLALDHEGHGLVEGLRLDKKEPRVRLIPLGGPATVIGLAPTPTPSPTEKPVSKPVATKVIAAKPTASPRPRRSYPGAPPILHLIQDAGPRIAISYDGGSSSLGAREVLQVLNLAGVRTTLFLTGEFIEREPAFVRQAVLAGHEVGNHTRTHLHLTTYESNRSHHTLPGIDRETFEEQLRSTEQSYRRATGKPMAPLWRAPFGEENSELRSWALDLGYLHVRWSSLEGKSLDSRDWVKDEHSSLYQEPDQMMKRLLAFPRLSGGIVLMHLASDRERHPSSRLPYFLAELEKRNIRPVMVSELLQQSKLWRPWLAKAQANHLRIWGE